MEQLRALLGKRLGPLPAWSWAALGAAAFIGYLWWQRSRDEKLAVAPVADPYADAPADAGDIDGVEDGIGEGGSPLDLDTNSAWLRYVVDRLTATSEDPVAVGNALQKIFAGTPITEAERLIYRKAVAIAGYPPEGHPNIVMVSTPGTPTPKPPTPTPPKGVWVTVAKWRQDNPPWNSTLSGIAAKYYGNGSLWPRIWNHPNNAALVRRAKSRGVAHLILKDDRIYVPQ